MSLISAIHLARYRRNYFRFPFNKYIFTANSSKFFSYTILVYTLFTSAQKLMTMTIMLMLLLTMAALVIIQAIKQHNKKIIAHPIDFLVIDVDLNLLGCLHFESQIQHAPLLSFAVHVRFNDKGVRDALFAAATPHSTAAHQHLLQVTGVEWTASSVRALCRHVHGILGFRGVIVNYRWDSFARRFWHTKSALSSSKTKRACNRNYTIWKGRMICVQNTRKTAGTERRYCDFLLVSHSMPGPISHRFRVMTAYWPNFIPSIIFDRGVHCQ